MKFLPFIMLSVGLNAFAQLFLRKGMTTIKTEEVFSLVKYILNICFNTYIILGMLCYAISIFLWMFVLSKVNVSIAYPMQSFGYIFAIFIAFYTLGEPLNLYKILGALIICAGVFVISLSPDA